MQRDALGRFVIAGTIQGANGTWDFGVARLNADGTLDAHFGDHCTATYTGALPFQTDYDNTCAGLAITPEGYIYLAGAAEYDASHHARFEVVRLIGDSVFADDFEGDRDGDRGTSAPPQLKARRRRS